jgi:transcriptional regulator GlxA family with amidase domain
MMRKRVGIVVFDDVEILDFCGPFEVLSTTRLDETHRQEELSPFDVVLVAQSPGLVTTSGGMQVIPACTFETCPTLDLLLVPGGIGTRREMHNEAMLSFVRAYAARAEILAAVCTGSLILGNAGLLKGLAATSHWRSLQMMQELFPDVMVDSTSHVVDAGKVITSAGIAAGIDLSFHVVARFCGEEVSRATARHMEYPYPESFVRRIAL